MPGGASKSPKAANADALLCADQDLGSHVGQVDGALIPARSSSSVKDANTGALVAFSVSLMTQAVAVASRIGNNSSMGADMTGSYATSRTGHLVARDSVTAHRRPLAKLSNPRLTTVDDCRFRQAIEK